MKTIKHLTFGTLAMLSVALLFQTSIASAHGPRDRDNKRGDRDATVTFTKWITSDPNLPGLLETLEGVVGGDVGNGVFAGEVLKETITGDADEIVAFYHFTGSRHFFSAIVHIDYDLTNGKGVVIGVVTEGWLKGHALAGEMVTLESFEGHAPAFAATIQIKRD